MFFLVRMFQDRTSERNWQQLFSDFGFRQISGCLLVIALMPLNWAFEAKKWQLVLKDIQRISFIDSYKSVLLGTTLGNLSPFMVGDFVGRLRGIPNDLKPKSIAALLLSNGMQMFVLIIFSKIGYEILLFESDAANTTVNIVFRHLLIIPIVLGIFFFTKSMKLPSFASLPHIDILNEYSKSEIFKLFNWALLRHFVFTIQFVVLLMVFDVDLSTRLLVGLVSIVFLFKTFGAVLGMFGDIISRQLTVAYFFAYFSVALEPVLVAATLLWLINIFVPMFIGAFLIFSRKTANLNQA